MCLPEINEVKMKDISLYSSLLIILVSCAHGNFGYYNRDTNNTYSLRVGGAVENPKYTLRKGAYELCKKNHRYGGFKLLQNERKSGGMGSWTDARVRCTGKKDSFLEKNYSQDKGTFIEYESNSDEFEKKYEIK